MGKRLDIIREAANGGKSKMTIRDHKKALDDLWKKHHEACRVHEDAIKELRAKKDSTPSGKVAKAKRDKKSNDAWGDYREPGRSKPHESGW